MGEDEEIIAYWKGGDNINEKNIKKYLELKLPGYMIPKYYIKLEEIPLNRNGKVEKKKLPKLDFKKQKIHQNGPKTLFLIRVLKF